MQYIMALRLFTSVVVRVVISALVITVITNVVNVVMTLPGIYLIEKAGRRSLLLWGAVVMTICEYLGM